MTSKGKKLIAQPITKDISGRKKESKPRNKTDYYMNTLKSLKIT